MRSLVGPRFTRFTQVTADGFVYELFFNLEGETAGTENSTTRFLLGVDPAGRRVYFHSTVSETQNWSVTRVW